MSKSKLYRVLCLMLSLMLLSCVGITAYAQETAAEDGTAIQIRTVEELYNVRNDLTADYILMNDIDLTEATAAGGDWDFMGNGWNPIGSGDIYTAQAFSGTFDGNGHKIIGMRIDVTTKPSGASTIYLGLFAKVTGTVKDLTMADGSIKTGISATTYIGSVAGYNSGTIENCTNNCTVSCSTGSYSSYAGGIVGYNSGTISLCKNTADKIYTYSSSSGYAGGITGYGVTTGTISKCYNTGKVTASASSKGAAYAAGICIGNSVSDCYNAAEVTASNSSYTSYSYAYAYGIGGTATWCYNVGPVSANLEYDTYPVANSCTGCFYLNGLGKNVTGSTALTEAQLLLPSVYAGFDFTNTWVQNPDACYPYPQLSSNPQDLRVLYYIELGQKPNKVEYAYGEALDLTGCTLQVVYDTETETVAVTEDMVSGYDPQSPGTQYVTVSYLGHTVGFEVTVAEKVYKEIRTIEELYNIRKDLTANYRLMNDIDLTQATAAGGDWDFMGNGWNPIGSNDIYGNYAFSGDFDGNGHKIIGMRIDVTTLPSGTSTVYLGLFARVTGRVENLTMSGCSVRYNKSSSVYMGSVAGYCEGVISYCSNDGAVYAQTSTNTSGYAGGIAGGAGQTAIFTYCFNTGAVSSYAPNSSSSSCIGDLNNAGGIVGSSNAKTVIECCYNTADIHAKAAGQSSYYGTATAAGIANNGMIYACYNTGAITTSKQISYGCRYSYGIGGNNATGCYNIGTVTGYESEYAITGNVCANSYYLTGTGESSTGATALTESQMKLQSMYAGFDFGGVWVQDPYAVYPYPQLQSIPQNLEEGVSSLSLISWPLKLEYFVGEELVLDGCMMDLTYASGRKELILVTADMVTGYDKTKLGDQTLTVTYRGGTDSFDVTVVARPEVASIEMATQPIRTEFTVATAFDFTGAQIKVTYVDGNTEILDVTADMTMGGNINKLGTQTITVVFEGQTTTFTVKVKSAVPQTLRLDTLPTKLTYLEGDSLDLTGLTVTIIMNNGVEYPVSSGYTVSGYSSEPGTHTVTVTYLGKTATFEVTVQPKSVVTLTVQTAPSKTAYISGEKFDGTGMVLMADYDNGETAQITEYQVSGFDGIPGTKTVVLSHGGKTAQLTVQVAARTIEKPGDLTSIAVNAADQTYCVISAQLYEMILRIDPADGVSVTMNGTQLALRDGIYEEELTGETLLVVKNDSTQDLELTASIKDAIPLELFDVTFARMILGNALEFQFAIPVSGMDNWTGAYAVIEKEWADGTTTTKTVPVDQWQTATITGTNSHYVISYDGLAAKEMADNFYVTVYNRKDQAVSNPWTDSVRTYVSRTVDKQNDETRTMMVDMLNYGAQAQIAFDYNTEDLANSKLTDAQKAYATAQLQSVADNRIMGDNYLGTRLILESRIQVQVAFLDLTRDMYALYSYTDHYGVQKNVKVAGTEFVESGVLCVELNELVYADARKIFTVTIYNADGSVYATVTDSIESYAQRFMSTSGLYEALMKFTDSTYAYLH